MKRLFGNKDLIFVFESKIAKIRKKIEGSTGSDDNDIYIGVISDGSENIKCANTCWILELFFSKTVFDIQNTTISLEIIVKNTPSSNDNIFFCMIHIHPYLRFFCWR